jgi:hypothetical protein
MQFLMRLVRWGSVQSPLVRWATVAALVSLAILSRYTLGRVYGAIPAVTFYPMILLVTALFSWKEGVVALGVSVLSGSALFRQSAMYLMPVGWSLVGGLSITIIHALKIVAEQLAAANERQTVLFQEMQHRVANTLQSLSVHWKWPLAESIPHRQRPSVCSGKPHNGPRHPPTCIAGCTIRPCFTVACNWFCMMP